MAIGCTTSGSAANKLTVKPEGSFIRRAASEGGTGAFGEGRACSGKAPPEDRPIPSTARTIARTKLNPVRVSKRPRRNVMIDFSSTARKRMVPWSLRIANGWTIPPVPIHAIDCTKEG